MQALSVFASRHRRRVAAIMASKAHEDVCYRAPFTLMLPSKRVGVCQGGARVRVHCARARTGGGAGRVASIRAVHGAGLEPVGASEAVGFFCFIADGLVILGRSCSVAQSARAGVRYSSSPLRLPFYAATTRAVCAMR